MSPRARNLMLVSLVAAVVSATLLFLGYWLNQRLGLGAAVGATWGAAIFAGLLATAAYYRAIVDRRRPPGP